MMTLANCGSSPRLGTLFFLWCEDFYTLLIGYYFLVLACCEARGHHLGGIGC